jgi:hypothetical protein
MVGVCWIIQRPTLAFTDDVRLEASASSSHAGVSLAMDVTRRNYSRQASSPRASAGPPSSGCRKSLHDACIRMPR